MLTGTREGLVPDLSMRGGDNSIVGGCDVHGPTTVIQGRCALSTDTPLPLVAANLRARDNRPRGLLSCKQSKNKQEQDETRTNSLCDHEVGVPNTSRTDGLADSRVYKEVAMAKLTTKQNPI